MENKILVNSEVSEDDCLFPLREASLSSVEELTLGKEEIILKFLKRLGSSFSFPTITDSELENYIPDVLKSLDFFSNLSLNKIPELFFKEPESSPLVCVTSPVFLDSGEVSNLSFRSSYEPFYPEYKDRIKSEPRWNAVKAKYWRHKKHQSLGTVIAVHGWMMDDEKFSSLALVPGLFFRMGLDVVLFELPFHGSRKPEKFIPAMMFPGLDPACTNESFAQAIFELRSIRKWLQAENNKPIITVGLSLGAQVCALWSSLDKLDASICVSPLVSVSDLAWSQIKDTQIEQSLLKSGISIDLLDKAFSVSSPLSYQNLVKKEDILIISGLDDRVVPSSHSERLWNHWGRPQIYWLDDGHLEQLVSKGTSKVVHEFLKGRGYAWDSLIIVQRI